MLLCYFLPGRSLAGSGKRSIGGPTKYPVSRNQHRIQCGAGSIHRSVNANLSNKPHTISEPTDRKHTHFKTEAIQQQNNFYDPERKKTSDVFGWKAQAKKKTTTTLSLKSQTATSTMSMCLSACTQHPTPNPSPSLCTLCKVFMCAGVFPPLSLRAQSCRASG